MVAIITVLQDAGQDVLQLSEAGPQRGSGKEPELVRWVQGQDGNKPPTPSWSIFGGLGEREKSCSSERGWELDTSPGSRAWDLWDIL